MRQSKGFLCFPFLFCFFANEVLANSVPLAILGGQGNAPYAAFLNADGTITKLSGLPATGLTYRVAMNLSGNAIIGGTDGLNAYAALVSPGGILKPITGLIAPGEIYSVAINQTGNSIIGGGHLNTNVPFAAIVSSDGIATSLALPSSGLIYSVALNNSGRGIVAGIGPSNSAYASLVSPNGAVTPLLNLPTTGAIYWAAVNDAQTAFIGGQDNTSIYAAFVDKNGLVKPVANLPEGINFSVALNANGNAIMGGTSLTLPYAALVSANGSVITLTDLPKTAGKIYNVTINASGTGLIAGFSTQGPYGSLVAPDGSLTPLRGLPIGDGFLDGAALHATGVGIVGGSFHNSPFAALVAPNGTLTYLNGLPLQGEINSIGIAVLDNLVPKSIGPFDSEANMQFALSDTLTQHNIIHKNDRRNLCTNQLSQGNSSLWMSTFGSDVHEKSQHAFPDFTNKIAGIMLGLDYMHVQDVVFGGGLAYTHNSVNYSEQNGDASINQESAVVYASWNNTHVYMNAALWGGSFQTTNNRRSLSFITSTATPYGWNLVPHIELNAPITASQEFTATPFIAFDWANNWQYHFREQGSSGFNVQLNNQYVAILRSESGFRFFETLQYQWGHLILEEEISYVNRTPTQKSKGTASFIGAASSFNVETLNSATQNLGNAKLHIEFVPCNLKNVYASLDYQGEFGSLLHSNMVTLSVGKDF